MYIVCTNRHADKHTNKSTDTDAKSRQKFGLGIIYYPPPWLQIMVT